MCTNKKDVKDLIKKAKSYLKKNDLFCEMVKKYIDDAEKMLPDIKGKLTSEQEEIYKNLEAAVGP